MPIWGALKYFKKEEFACHCGCGSEDMNPGHMKQLDQARGLAGIPFKINSGYRCSEHNRAIGSKDTSSHLRGWATDIETGDDSRCRFLILRALIVVGFRRVGIAKTFIHVDNDPDKDQKVGWLYQRREK